MIFPALVNAHDHLELNHYPRTKYQERYDSAHQWAEDVNRHLDEPPFDALRKYSLEDRLFIGGLKNLLCGALYVAHHNPPHKPMFSRTFPVTVLKKYGWAHSLRFSSDAELALSYQKRPKRAAWFIHLAEGIDEEAAGEFQRLKKKGYAAQDTILIHGVGLTEQDMAHANTCRGLVICPTTNVYLLGRTAAVEAWIKNGGRAALGSDSRLTAKGDLLDEIALARELLPPHIVDTLCDPVGAASMVGFTVNTRRDYFIAKSFPRSRAEIQLIVKGGVPQIGDPEFATEFRHSGAVRCMLDGAPKLINRELAKRIAACKLKEAGLVLSEELR